MSRINGLPSARRMRIASSCGNISIWSFCCIRGKWEIGNFRLLTRKRTRKATRVAGVAKSTPSLPTDCNVTLLNDSDPHGDLDREWQNIIYNTVNIYLFILYYYNTYVTQRNTTSFALTPCMTFLL